MAILIETNEYQTPITEELLSQYPEEVVQQFTEIVNIVPFIKNLINPNRPKIEDLPRDKEGRAIVDITNPPIYKDADYFRQAALFYLKNDCYTKLRPNSNPNSEYRKYWREELRRCREGLIRQSDGMYVTGFLYWFLNYCPMMVNFYKEGQKKAIRKESFGFFFEGIWWRSIYLYNAREQGHHAIELAKRGAHPYNQKVFTPLGWRKWKDIKIGDELYGTYGNITKVIDIPYDKECDVYKITLRDGRKILASDEHLWKIEFHNRKEIQIMTTLELLKEYKRKRKISDRNPLGIEYVCSIPKNKGVEMSYNKTKVDAYTFGLLLGDGSFRYCSCYYTQDPKDLEVERKYIPYNIIKWKAKYAYRIDIPNWHKILEEYGLYNKKSEDKFIPDEYKYNSREVRFNLLKGLMDSDGTLDNKGRYIIALSSKRMIEDIAFICRSLGYNCSYTIKKTGYKVNGVIKDCLPSYALTIFTRDIIANLPRKQKKEKVITNQYSINKELRTKIINIEYVGKQKAKCVTVDSKDNCYLIGDFVTTHNCAKSYFLATIMSHNLIVGESEATHKRCITVLTAAQKEYLKDDKDGTLNKFIPELSFVIDNTPFPNLLLKNSPNEMSWQMGYKKPNGAIGGSMNQVLGVSAKDDSDKLRGKRGWILYEEMGTFDGLLELYDVTRKSVEDGDYTFSCMYLVGTANNKESSFLSAKKLLYAPESYNIQSVPNVYDKKGSGKDTFGFFFPAYINRAGCYNKDGISDVIKALLQVLMARYKSKYGADPTSVLRVIAEDPITPAEAIIKVKDAYFPVASLQERADTLDKNPSLYDDIYVGELYTTGTGEIEFRPTDDIPIRTYPVDNDTKGALEIYSMPKKDREGKVFNDRYIIGVDPYDNDQAESHSLYSIFVLDTFVDDLAAEYTGRTNFADEAHDMVLKLCIFYNAKALYESNKKGLYSYMEKNRATFRLADTPEYLRDKQLVKYSSFGSSAKGVNVSANINNFANRLIKDWLLMKVPVEVKQEDGHIEIQEIPKLYKLKNRALIEELIQFNPDINVDRIRALGMLMLYREQYIIRYGTGRTESSSEILSKDYAGNDEFFTKNFDARHIGKQ